MRSEMEMMDLILGTAHIFVTLRNGRLKRILPFSTIYIYNKGIGCL